MTGDSDLDWLVLLRYSDWDVLGLLQPWHAHVDGSHRHAGKSEASCQANLDLEASSCTCGL